MNETATEPGSFRAVAKVDDVPPKKPLCLTVDGHAIALCRFKDEIYCVENLCSHAMATFDDGRIRGFRIMCPLHGGTFDVRSGEACGAPARLPIRSYPVRVEGGEVLVELPG